MIDVSNLKKFHKYNVCAIFPDGKKRVLKCESTNESLIDFLFEVENLYDIEVLSVCRILTDEIG